MSDQRIPGHTRDDAGVHDRLIPVARVVAVMFLVVGIAGFIPGLTSNYDSMSAAGHESHAELLGIFQVSVLHNVVHLLLGVVGLVMSRTRSGARSFLIGGGIVYLVLW